jgi:iron complex outermembrane receptor protein
LRIGLEYLHARYRNLPNANNVTLVGGVNTAVIADWSGRRPVRAPDFSGTVGADYAWMLGRSQLVLTGTLSFSSRFAPTNASFQCDRVSHDGQGNDIAFVLGTAGYCARGQNRRRGRFEENGYAMLNLQLAWTDPTRRYSVTVYGNNVTDTRFKYLSRGLYYGTDNYYSAPWSVGVRLAVSI